MEQQRKEGKEKKRKEKGRLRNAEALNKEHEI